MFVLNTFAFADDDEEADDATLPLSERLANKVCSNVWVPLGVKWHLVRTTPVFAQRIAIQPCQVDVLALMTSESFCCFNRDPCDIYHPIISRIIGQVCPQTRIYTLAGDAAVEAAVRGPAQAQAHGDGVYGPGHGQPGWACMNHHVPDGWVLLALPC